VRKSGAVAKKHGLPACKVRTQSLMETRGPAVAERAQQRDKRRGDTAWEQTQSDVLTESLNETLTV
jgi:hypothetical protein